MIKEIYKTSLQDRDYYIGICKIRRKNDKVR